MYEAVADESKNTWGQEGKKVSLHLFQNKDLFGVDLF